MNSAATRFPQIIPILCLAWLAAAICITWPGMKWEIELLHRIWPNYFGPFVVASPLLLSAWRWLRGRFLRRHEFAVFIGGLLALCFASEPRAAATVMLVSGACFSVGRRFTRALGTEALGPIAEIAVSTALGLGLLHCALSVIGLAGWYVWPVFAALFGVPLLLCFRELRTVFSALQKIDELWTKAVDPGSWAGALLSARLVLFLLFACVCAISPSLVRPK